MSDAPSTMILTFKSRLNPDARQYRALKAILAQQGSLFNAALEERILAYAKGKSVSEVEQSRSLTQIRADDPDFAAIQRRIQRGTLKRLDRAYKSFFRRVKEGAGASSGFPKFKGEKFFDSFSFDAFQQIKYQNGRLYFSGMPGGLRVMKDRSLPQCLNTETGELETRIKNVWFKAEDRCGNHINRWHVGFQVEVPCAPPRDKGKSIGVDWGTSVLAALSSGEMIANPKFGRRAAKALARVQRKVARGVKGSKRRSKVLRHKRAIERQTANRRRNTLDKFSKRLATHYKVVAVETFPIKDLMNAERVGETLPQFVKTERNRKVLDTAPFLLRQMTAYKTTLYGSEQREVDPTHIVADGNMAQPTQRCAMCGGLHFKDMTEPDHVCTTPGMFHRMRLPRKVNAARVIEQLTRDSPPAGDNRDGHAPGGAAQAANASNGSRRLGKTEDEQSSLGVRTQKVLPSHTHGKAPRPPPGRLRRASS